MEKKKQHNPNSHKLPRRDSSSNSWSELLPELLNSVFERLGFADSRRAESVCSSWYSAARRCVSKKQSPWLILLPDEDDNRNSHSCTLFNPDEKGKLYKRRDQGVEFAQSCLATYGSWLFMLDHWYNFFFLNLFTHERINLPPLESQLGATKLERISDGWFRISDDIITNDISMQSPVFWIDEQTKDYVVLWGLGKWCVVYSKKGDKFWNQIPLVYSPGYSHMVYKDHKLYYILNDFFGFFGSSSCIKIFDFSGEIPQESFQGGVTPNSSLLHPTKTRRISDRKLVVTVTGDVLKVEKWVNPMTRIWSFCVYKAMLFDLGITVLANDDIQGFKRNSIYYSIICREKNTTQICLFNLETQKMEPLHKFDCSSTQQLSRARWFLPSFTQP
ncbi:hypothetical protein EUTSA_v10013780mg [Eutrema salsugineum]|uniref:F-box domain-containing protein n=1 Tax=Eutrema salsugineum TaxID=72664 RepID=V4LIR7_EUTSA|nr:hypothetical protein EUTSA_v10013780mg [Eutrema salsugineum]